MRVNGKTCIVAQLTELQQVFLLSLLQQNKGIGWYVELHFCFHIKIVWLKRYMCNKNLYDLLLRISSHILSLRDTNYAKGEKEENIDDYDINTIEEDILFMTREIRYKLIFDIVQNIDPTWYELAKER